MTNHAYWNLAGHGAGSEALLAHRLWLPRCSRFTPVGPTLVPTGTLKEVKGTPLDFSQGPAAGTTAASIADGTAQITREQLSAAVHSLGSRIGVLSADTDLGRGTGGGYDFNFCVDRDGGERGGHAAAEVDVALLYDPNSGRGMKIASDQPGLQVYTANFVNAEQERYQKPKGDVEAYCRWVIMVSASSSLFSHCLPFFSPHEYLRTSVLHSALRVYPWVLRPFVPCRCVLATVYARTRARRLLFGSVIRTPRVTHLKGMVPCVWRRKTGPMLSTAPPMGFRTPSFALERCTSTSTR